MTADGKERKRILTMLNLVEQHNLPNCLEFISELNKNQMSKLQL